MGKKYTRTELKNFIETICNYGNTIVDPEDKRMSTEMKAKYEDLITYMAAPYDENGKKSLETSLEFFDVLAEYCADQYFALGKEMEISNMTCPIAPNEMEDKENGKTLRENFINAVAIFNTMPGSRINAPVQYLPFIDNVFETKDYKKMGKMAGFETEEFQDIKSLYQALVESKVNAKMKTLSDEDKAYLKAGYTNIYVPAPNSTKYDKVDQAWKFFADYKMRKTNEELDEIFANDNDKSNKFLDRFDGLKDKIMHYNNNIKPNVKSKYDELFNIDSKKHTNSDKYNEIVEAYNKFNSTLEKANLNGENDIFESKPDSLAKRKTLDGVCDRLEASVVDYLEGKWKTRWTPLGKQRYDQVLKILETVNPEKAQSMKEFHEKKRDGIIDKKMSFEDFRSDNSKKKTNVNELIDEEKKSGSKKKDIGKVKASKEKTKTSKDKNISL